MKKIEALTAEQEAYLPVFRQKYLDIACGGGRASRAELEVALADAYSVIGKPAPKLLIFGSPAACMVALKLLRGQLWDQLGGQLWGQLRDQLGDQLRDQLGDQLGDQLWGQLWGQLGDQLGDQLGRQLWRHVSSWNDAYWVAHRTSALELADMPAAARLAAFGDLASQAGWWWPYAGVLILTDRPTVISRDKDRRLHNPTGPALAYTDGYTLHAWHGTRVPADLIETGWDVERIFDERNTEIRRCAIERLGWPQFIADSGMTRVGEPAPDPGNEPHLLELYDLPERLAGTFDQPARVLLCTNGSCEFDGSRHRFGLIVPAHHDDPIEAAADLYGWPSAAYRTLQVRR